MSELISVAVPLYNGAKYIMQGIPYEVCKQSYSNIELILVNDGSKDNTAEVLAQFKEKYPEKNIVIVDQKNQGIAGSRNNALKIAKGDYMMYLDQDDHIPQDYVEKLYRKIKDSDYDMVLGGYKTVDESLKDIHRFEFTKADEWTPFRFIVPWSKIYRMSFLRENNLSFLDYPIGEDIFFSLCAYSKAKIGTIPFAGYAWVQNQQSFSHTVQKQFSETDLRPLFNSVWDAVFKEDCIVPKTYQYFFLKTIVYQILNASRGHTFADTYEYASQMFDWYDGRFEKERRKISSIEPKSEPWMVRKIVRFVNGLRHTVLWKPFLRIYVRL